MIRFDKTRNTIRNIFFGTISRIVLIILPFVIRTVFIYTLGIEYLGLNTLFSSILSVLSLAELGIGSALCFSMYKPIAENDTSMVCALMNLYRKCYRIIGCIIAAVGLILIPFLPYLINTDLPENVNLYVLYLLNLFSTVITYFLFAYKNCLLEAYQRNDITSIISIIINIVRYVIQGLVLIYFKNYYLYLIIAPIFTIISNCVTSIIVSRKYPQYHPCGMVDSSVLSEIKKKVSALVLYKIGNVVLNSVDNIVISAFLGLSVLAIYGNYYYVMSSIFGFMSIITSSMLAGVGNSVVTDTVDKNNRDFNKFSFIQLWLVGWCTICLLCLYQPFMYLWVGKELSFSFSTVIWLCILFYVWKMGDIVGVYKEALGMWYEDRFRPIIGAAVNLTVNLILVQVIGINGIIISSVVSIVFITFPFAAKVLYKNYFKKQVAEYYIMQIKRAGTTIFAAVLTYICCAFLKEVNIITFIIRIIICIIVPNLIYIILYHKSPMFGETKDFILSIFKRLVGK